MSDLISREAVINAIADTILNGESLGYVLAEEIVSETPPADIMEYARKIKDYCEGFPNCEGCRFYKEFPFRCAFGICPQEWNLPEGEEGLEK